MGKSLGEEFTQETADVGGIRLNYHIGGKGEPLLLWHGFLGTSYIWRKIAPILVETFTVIAPDMRGYGDSDKPPEGYDALTLANDFRSLVRKLGHQKVSIIAFDMGAPPALIYAGEYPEDVAGLIYLDEPVITESNLAQVIRFTPEATQHGGLWWWQFALAPGVAETLIVGNEHEFLSWFYDNYTFDPSSIEQEAKEEYLRSFKGRESVTGAFGVYRSIFETMEQTQKFEGLFSKVDIPILGLGGEKSIGDKTAKMLETVSSNVAGGAVEKCGHFIPEERPDYLATKAKEFFAR